MYVYCTTTFVLSYKIEFVVMIVYIQYVVAPSIHANSRRSTVSLFRSVYESTFVRKVRTPYNSSVDYTYTKLVTDTYADTFKVKNAITTVVLGVPVEYLRIPSRFVLSK